MSYEKIIEKIRKLLELAGNNPNQNEAIAAALKAQRLMAEHDVSEVDLTEGEPQREVVEVSSSVGQHKAWRDWLASAIADNFRCKTYVHRHGYVNSRSKRFTCVERTRVFVGYQMDANAACMTFEHLYRIGNKLANRACAESRKKYGTASGVYNLFVAGFVRGVRQELEKQSQALMLVCPAQVEESFAEKVKFAKTAGRGARFNSAPYDARQDGEQAGREAVRASRLGESQQLGLAA